MISTVGPLFRDHPGSKHAAISDDFAMDLPSSLNSTQEEIFWFLATSHSAVSQNWPTGRPPRSEHSNGTCDPWHARQWEISQIVGWARLHDVGGQTERWRAHCCHVLPRVSDQPASDEAIPEKGEGFRRHQRAQS